MSMNFRPNRSDSGLLSTRQAKRLSSQEAYESHLAEGLQSCGTWSFTAQETGLNVIDDSAEPGMPEGHASVDFTELTRGQAERRGKEIRGLARLTYTPDEVTSQA